MVFDFSGVDAELSALDPAPPELAALSAKYAAALGALDEIDASLAALGAGLDVPARVILDDPPRTPPTRMPTRIEEQRPKSGEIHLGAPVQRPAEPMSAEVPLLDSDSNSGAFELAGAELRIDDLEVDPFASPERPRDEGASPLSLQPTSARASEPMFTSLDVDPFRFDEEIEFTNTRGDLFAADQGEPDTIVISQDRDADRDADAEFDALFDEATHPSGIPTRSFDMDDETLTAEDLLSGLTGPNERANAAAANALFGELEPTEITENTENTDIIDSNALAAHLDPFPADEELGSSEFEIVLDDAGEARDLVPSQPPEALSLGGTEKRPSFLGRLFGRKDDKA